MNSYRATVQRCAKAASGAASSSGFAPHPLDTSNAAPPPSPLLEVADWLMADRGGLGACHRLGLRPLVADHADKWVVCDVSGEPRLVAMLAPPLFPDALAGATARALAARERLDGQAAAAVVIPLFSGHCQGLSFAITPYLRPVAPRGAEARWDLWRLRAHLLAWLREVTRRTARTAPADMISAAFADPLRRLADCPDMAPLVRGHARDALADLEGQRWRPVLVVAHNDLWGGNLLLGPNDGNGPGFGVTDWGASRCDGHAAYDLVRVAISLRLSRASFAAELAAHAALLGCEFGQMRHHLVAALARLGDHLGEWPQAHCAQTAARCAEYLEDAIPQAD